MTTTCRIAACLLFLSCVSTVIFAAQETRPLIAAASAEKVRFLSPGPVRQLRVQIFSPDGSPLFDSDWKDGNVLDWPADNALASGSYRCLAMVREMDGRVTQKEFSIEQSDDAGLKVMLLVHDGFNGSLVSTSGDLVFRFGNFLAANVRGWNGPDDRERFAGRTRQRWRDSAAPGGSDHYVDHEPDVECFPESSEACTSSK